MTPTCIALGANLGNAPATLVWALTHIAQLPGTRLLAASSLYASAPVDASGPDYHNAAALLHTTLSAPALLEHLHTIEARAGRERPYRNAPRTLDLDLLLYANQRHHGPSLTLPHPRLHERAFVLHPLHEIFSQITDIPSEWQKITNAENLQKVSHQRIQRLAPYPTPAPQYPSGFFQIS